jgi:hypothetical protein
MRDRVIDALGDLAHSRFLVYLMGPYKTFDIDPVLDAAETEATLDLDQLPETVDCADSDTPAASQHERVVFIHDDGVRSAMIAAVTDRWDARVYSYSDREDLVRQVRLFIRDLARREQRGDLPTLDQESS